MKKQQIITMSNNQNKGEKNKLEDISIEEVQELVDKGANITFIPQSVEKELRTDGTGEPSGIEMRTDTGVPQSITLGTTMEEKDLVINRICSVRFGSMDDKQFKATLEHNINILLSQSRAETIKEIEGIKKYHKEFECNGAFNGKGCYESFCEDQNCRNAPKEYNQALKDIINLLSKDIEQ